MTASDLRDEVELIIARSGTPEQAWGRLCERVLVPDLPFEEHQAAHRRVFNDGRLETPAPCPVWIPDAATLAGANLTRLMHDRGVASYSDLHRWSVEQRLDFWEEMIGRLGIQFTTAPDGICSDEIDIESPGWLPGARLNIADTCFAGNGDRTAVICAGEDGLLHRLTLGKLETLTNRVAAGLTSVGIEPGDAIAVGMPMTVESVAIYLGVIRAGGMVVSIADSFAATEIATRLRIANAKLIFTQDVIRRGGRVLPLYERVVEAAAPRAVVLPAGDSVCLDLRAEDLAWCDFLSDNEMFQSVPCRPHDYSNILFSSGTTGDPKAIPWTHTTPIKCAADAWLHHDIHPDDVVAWPTNLGWMMGPWLIYAALVNRATIALYDGAPNTRGFCEFVQNAKVSMLGVVPSLVQAWRAADATSGLDWSAIRAFSSTGECSNADDMFWLMSRAGYKPVIEYCGGTEIGGGYITGTVLQPGIPATFTTAAMGLDLAILDHQGAAAESGELFLIPPSIGLSTTLLNRDHHAVYYEGAPSGPNNEVLRRHGDEMRRLPGGFFQALGRADDTMNLGGIKISSAEIERVLNELEGVRETAAIAVPPAGGGPDRLIVFAVLETGADISADDLADPMRTMIRERLNPLFRIADVRQIHALPRTASNKVMRRKLREACLAESASP